MLPCLAQKWSGVIDPARAVDWSSAGVAGGIPSSAWTQCGSTITAYTGTASTINTAISGCAANHYVLLGAGTFNLSTGIDFAGKSHVAVRGNGANSTFIVFTGGCAGNGVGANICMNGANNSPGGEQNVGDWTAGYSAGTTVITLANVGSTTPAVGNISNLAIGSILYLDQLDTATDTGWIWNCLVTNVCSNGATGGAARTDGTCNGGMCNRSQQQAVVVTNISGLNITVSPGLYMPNWATGQKPQAWYGNSYITGSGIETLSIDNSGSTETYGILLMGCTQCWVSGVRSLTAKRGHVALEGATHSVVQNSYFYQNQSHAAVSYGIDMFWGNSDNLIQNNICQQVTDSCPNNNGGAEGNVIAYNFAIADSYTTPAWMQPPFYQHASGDSFFLWEGNIGAGYIADNVHGTHHFDTLFRNRLRGWESICDGSPCSSQTDAIQIYASSRFFNIVGNVNGQTSYHTNYACSANPGSPTCASGNISIYTLGFTGNGGAQNTSIVGFNSDCGGTGGNDSDKCTTTGLMRWGNYDTVNAANQFVNAEVPSGLAQFSNAVPSTHTLPASFYLSAKPAFWQGEPWPPIGPDVVSGNLGRCSGGTYDGSLATSAGQCTGGTLATDVSGEANSTPALDCFLNSMSGKPDGTGSALTFNPGTCYPAGPVTGYSPVSLAFGNQIVSTTSAGQTITLTNNGAANLVTTAIALQTGTQFSIDGTSTCVLGGQTLTPTSSCTIVIKFTPTSVGAKSDNVQVTSNAPSSVDNLALTGTGIQAASSYAPSSVPFGNQTATTTSSPQTVTLTNSGTSNLITTGITLTGANTADFAISGGTCNTSGQTIAPAASCTVTATFTPASVASFTANLHFVSNAPTSPDNIVLTGAGVSPSQAATPVFLPANGIVPQSPTITTSSTGTVIICWAVSPTVPVTNTLGTGCNTGTALVNGAAMPPVSTPATINAVAGTSTLADSGVASASYTGATAGAYNPLVILWQAPQSSDTTNFNTAVASLLPHLSGIGGSSSTATGSNLGNVYWSDIDDCSTTAPCAAEANYDWANIDTQLMAYINAPIGANGTFGNGCAGGRRCDITLRIAPQQDSGSGVTKTPTYVMSHTYALSLGAPDQDVSFAAAWPGAISVTWPGTVPCTNITTGNDACIANTTTCTAYGAAVCGSPVGPPNASQNLSGFPVVYEVPIVTAYQKFLTAIFAHYSLTGSGNGPTIFPYISSIAIGFAAGAENNPGNVGTGAVTNGILATTFWPGPKGLAAEPQGFSQCGYLTNWFGTAQNGIAGCATLPNDGDGYVTAMDKFFATLNTHGITISQSSHGGPPSNSNTFNATPIAPYADAEAILASIYGKPSGNFAGAGFGQQSERLSDMVNNAAGAATTQNWVANFQRFTAPVHHLITVNDGGANPHAAEFGIASVNGITCTGAGPYLCTVHCLGTNGTSCEVFGDTSTVFITGNNNPNYNGFQQITCGGTCPSNTIQFTSADNSGGSLGQLWSPSYLPLLLPFASQHQASYVGIWECDADYTYGVTTSNQACGGNPGPDANWDAAIRNFESGLPASTSAIKGKASCLGKCSSF